MKPMTKKRLNQILGYVPVPPKPAWCDDRVPVTTIEAVNEQFRRRVEMIRSIAPENRHRKDCPIDIPEPKPVRNQQRHFFGGNKRGPNPSLFFISPQAPGLKLAACDAEKLTGVPRAKFRDAYKSMCKASNKRDSFRIGDYTFQLLKKAA